LFPLPGVAAEGNADGGGRAITPVLVVENPAGGRTRQELKPLPFTIGRQGGNSLVLRDNRVSRQHAAIVAEGGGYWVEDAGSRLGVFVNGAKVRRARLQHRDRVDFGLNDSYAFTFLDEPEPLGKLYEHVSGPQNLAKLRSLVEVARAAQRSLSTDDVLRAVLDAALTITGAERGFLLLNLDADEDLEVALARDRHKNELPKEELTVPTRLIRQALESRQEMLSMNFDPLAQQGVLPEHTVARLELRSVICVPLVRMRGEEAVGTQGVLYLDSRLAPTDLSAGNPELLQTLALEASTILENARLLEEDRQNQKLEEEMEIARAIQRSLLPASLPAKGWFQAAGSSQPAFRVGGDYFDVHPAEHGTWSVVVTDVSGKGASSALLASLLQGAFLAAGTVAIPKLLERLNAFLLERTQGEKYATVFYTVVFPDGLMAYANAGLCPPLVVRAATGEIETLDPTSMPLGLLEEAQFEVAHQQLAAGDLVLCYSDGVEDAANADGAAFGKKRLRALAREMKGLSAAEAHELLRVRVLEFVGAADLADDLTILAFRYGASGGASV
jgi:phosphoserine phosphatase RsbU/P